jgi:hypothetical protein
VEREYTEGSEGRGGGRVKWGETCRPRIEARTLTVNALTGGHRPADPGVCNACNAPPPPATSSHLSTAVPTQNTTPVCYLKGPRRACGDTRLLAQEVSPRGRPAAEEEEQKSWCTEYLYPLWSLKQVHPTRASPQRPCPSLNSMNDMFDKVTTRPPVSAGTQSPPSSADRKEPLGAPRAAGRARQTRTRAVSGAPGHLTKFTSA